MKAFDPNDPRPLRIMIFPDKPQTILIHVPDGQELWLPLLKTPFDLDVLCKALDDRDLPHVTTEGDPGRWWRNATQMENDEKAERTNQLKQTMAERMVQITTSPKATTIEKQRAELVLEKQKADDEIRQIKAQIGKAKSDAYTSGTYLPPLIFQQKQQRLADLQAVSLALQGRLSELRQQLKEQNEQVHAQGERRFIEKAKRYLSREQYLAIWAEIHAENKREVADDPQTGSVGASNGLAVSEG